MHFFIPKTRKLNQVKEFCKLSNLEVIKEPIEVNYVIEEPYWDGMETEYTSFKQSITLTKENLHMAFYKDVWKALNKTERMSVLTWLDEVYAEKQNRQPIVILKGYDKDNYRDYTAYDFEENKQFLFVSDLERDNFDNGYLMAYEVLNAGIEALANETYIKLKNHEEFDTELNTMFLANCLKRFIKQDQIDMLKADDLPFEFERLVKEEKVSFPISTPQEYAFRNTHLNHKRNIFEINDIKNIYYDDKKLAKAKNDVKLKALTYLQPIEQEKLKMLNIVEDMNKKAFKHTIDTLEEFKSTYKENAFDDYNIKHLYIFRYLRDSEEYKKLIKQNKEDNYGFNRVLENANNVNMDFTTRFLNTTLSKFLRKYLKKELEQVNQLRSEQYKK